MPKNSTYPTRRAGRAKEKSKTNGANLGFEEKLWQAADKLRGHLDPAWPPASPPPSAVALAAS